MDDIKPSVITLRINEEQYQKLKKGVLVIKHSLCFTWLKASYRVDTENVIIRLVSVSHREVFNILPEYMTRTVKRLWPKELHSIKLVINKIISNEKY